MDQSRSLNCFSDILVIGQGRTASSITACLAASDSRITLSSGDMESDREKVATHLRDLTEYRKTEIDRKISITGEWNTSRGFDLVIITGLTDTSQIQEQIRKIELVKVPERILAIATDHIGLKELQEVSMNPDRVVVMNWSEPAHTTLFLEIVYNDTTDPEVVMKLKGNAVQFWDKDPYSMNADLGARGRMLAAMTREAMFLVDQGYAHIEDIDRACRNDGGTYLPFAGNFQYMDLMGTYAYGVVMEKLNQELDVSTRLPQTFYPYLKNVEADGSIQNGFYNITSEELNREEERMRRFSFEVRELMDKYPFGYLEEKVETELQETGKSKTK